MSKWRQENLDRVVEFDSLDSSQFAFNVLMGLDKKILKGLMRNTPSHEKMRSEIFPTGENFHKLYLHFSKIDKATASIFEKYR